MPVTPIDLNEGLTALLAGDLSALDDDISAPNTPDTITWGEQVRAAIQALITRLTGVESAYTVDFSSLATNTLTNGSEIIDGLTWTASNIASRTTLAEVTNGSGIRMTHLTGSSSVFAGTDTAPRIGIALNSLIPNYDPTARYMIMCRYSWGSAPDSTGEYFAMGLYAAAASPHTNNALRFRGVVSRLDSGGDQVHDLVSGATFLSELTNPRAIPTGTHNVLAIDLRGPTSFAAYSGLYSGGWPEIADLVPMGESSPDNAVAAGFGEVIHHPSVQLVLGLGATGIAATHSVTIGGLRILRMG